MCYYNYRLYRTTTKFISPNHSQQLLHSFRCGHCPECLEQSRKEWYLRTVYEYQDTIKSGGYMLFDCLTYRNNTIPKVSHYFDVPKSLDGYCFDYSHVTNFLKSLRTNLDRDGYDVKDNLRYFYATEYGEHNTKRSHIHILFFVRDNFIDPIELSQYIADAWSYGRTDGYPYKTKWYVRSHNVISSGMSNSIRVSSYVSKYVCKSLRYTDFLNARVVNILKAIYLQFARLYPVEVHRRFGDTECVESCDWKYDYSEFDSWVRSPLGKELFHQVKRRLDMFHNQSLGFGLSAISNKDTSYFIENPYLTVADADKVVLKISLPLYFKRKLFQEQVAFNGARFWQRNVQGDVFYHKQRERLFDVVSDRYYSAKINSGLSFDVPSVVRYVLYHRGYSNRFLGNTLKVSQVPVLPDILYNYSSSSDVRHFKYPFVSPCWIGSVQTDYDTDVGYGYSSDKYISDHAFLNPEFEKLIDKIEASLIDVKVGHYKADYQKERLKDLYDSVFSC